MLRAPPSNTRWGGKAHPRPRQRRMQLDEKNKQLPTVASITQRPVSGQASEAGRAARKAHSERNKPLLRLDGAKAFSLLSV